MKYFSELSRLESKLIELQTLKSLVTVMSNGVEHSNLEDIASSLYVVEGRLTEIHDSMAKEFYQLWDTVRDGK